MSAERERDEERLAILDALVAAMHRRDEVIDVIASSPDPKAAQQAVAALLRIDHAPARAVLDAQLRLFTTSYRDQLTADHNEIRDARHRA